MYSLLPTTFSHIVDKSSFFYCKIRLGLCTFVLKSWLQKKKKRTNKYTQANPNLNNPLLFVQCATTETLKKKYFCIYLNKYALPSSHISTCCLLCVQRATKKKKGGWLEIIPVTTKLFSDGEIFWVVEAGSGLHFCVHFWDRKRKSLGVRKSHVISA